MNTLDLLFEIRNKYGLSTIDMARLLQVREASVGRWITGKSEIPESVMADLIQIEEDIVYLSSYLFAHPELDNFTHAHFKAAINSLDTTQTQ